MTTLTHVTLSLAVALACDADLRRTNEDADQCALHIGLQGAYLSVVSDDVLTIKNVVDTRVVGYNDGACVTICLRCAHGLDTEGWMKVSQEQATEFGDFCQSCGEALDGDMVVEKIDDEYSWGEPDFDPFWAHGAPMKTPLVTTTSVPLFTGIQRCLTCHDKIVVSGGVAWNDDATEHDHIFGQTF